MDREKVVKEIEDALSGNLAKVGNVYRMSLNGLKDKALTDALALLKEQEATIKAQQFVLNNACEKLKEQKIAMKPKNVDKVGGNCPVCGLRMARSHKYCHQCGQEMDWE